MGVDQPESVGKKVDEAWKEQVTREKSRDTAPPREGKEGILRGQPQPARPTDKTERRPRGGAGSGAGPDFSFLLSSLSMQAMMALGELTPPGMNEPQADLEQARTLIDLLGVLEEKTRGNLTPEESSLLENILYELRMRYVTKTGGAG